MYVSSQTYELKLSSRLLFWIVFLNVVIVPGLDLHVSVSYKCIHIQVRTLQNVDVLFQEAGFSVTIPMQSRLPAEGQAFVHYYWSLRMNSLKAECPVGPLQIVCFSQGCVVEVFLKSPKHYALMYEYRIQVSIRYVLCEFGCGLQSEMEKINKIVY